MDIGFLLILVIIGIAVSIAASYILKLNPGVVALAFCISDWLFRLRYERTRARFLLAYQYRIPPNVTDHVLLLRSAEWYPQASCRQFPVCLQK